MINRVILTGRLTRDIELRTTNDGTPYTFFTIAVNRPGNNDQTDFVPCIAWRQTAELMNTYLNKGALIGVEGRLDVYTNNNDGQYETRVNVQVSQITFLESKADAEARTTEQNIKTVNNGPDTNMTFADEQHVDQTVTTAPKQQSVENKQEVNVDDIEF